ncbi:MAG: YtxH domain-containing protein [Nitrospira sp.]|nr:YtxH domain-containing protein [Nitrospira sp.]MBX3332757.1 YtxH domain-containing protein [Nitrospira sp.]MDR4462919.1 YtxH domain-containing protein [Nitrospira sp.]MDR4467569.1 YtxH domain-containing protein [Nitrospira sp.]
MANGGCGLMGLGLSFMMGSLIGGAGGLLYAPQSGVRTRGRIAELAENVRDEAGTVTEEATEKFHQAIVRGRRLVRG